jgi:hypothetical protein
VNRIFMPYPYLEKAFLIAGTLRASDTNTQVRTSGGVQCITHTLGGTRNGITGNITFEFDWTPPATDAGKAGRDRSITTPFTITIGSLPAAMSFGGLVPPYAGLYQFNVAIPEAAPDGDQPVVIRIGGISSTENSGCCFITVQR